MNCKHCQHYVPHDGPWADEYYGPNTGTCRSEHIVRELFPIPPGSLCHWSEDGMRSGFAVHEEFGCIHFKAEK